MIDSKTEKCEFTDDFNITVNHLMQKNNIQIAYANPKYYAELKEFSIVRFGDMAYGGKGLVEVFDNTKRTSRFETVDYACDNDQQHTLTQFYELPKFKAVKWPKYDNWEVECDAQLQNVTAKSIVMFVKKVGKHQKQEVHLMKAEDNPQPFLEDSQKVNKLVGSVLHNLSYYQKMLMATHYFIRARNA